MSSLRNAVPQKPYRERSQPGNRARHGLLEKKKDYKLRAKDHKLKKAKLKALQQKARDRNPDEFYFGMMRSQTSRDGRKRAEDGGRGNKALTQDVVKLLKTQDAGYINTMLQRVRKERERLETEIMIVEQDGQKILQTLGNDKPKTAKHNVFVESIDEQADFDAEDWFDTDADGISEAFNRPRRSLKGTDATDMDLETDTLSDNETSQKPRSKEALRRADEVRKLQGKRRKRLEDARLREKQLTIAQRELDQQRAKISGNSGGVNKNGVKFKQRERKR